MAEVTVNIEKGQGYGDTVKGAINGTIFEVPTGSDQKVSQEVADALSNSHVRFTVVAPAEGSAKGGSESGAGSEPSTTVEHTAIRDHAEDPALADPTASPQPLANDPEPINLADAQVILPTGGTQPAEQPSEAEAPKPAAKKTSK